MTRERKVLVTGGGGFLGGAIVRMLVELQEPVRSFSRAHYPALDQLGVEQIQGDLADAEAVDRACKGVEAVFHVAAKPGIWGPYESYFRTNVIGTRHVIASCRNHAVDRLIYTSSPSVVFDGTHMEGVDESVPYPSVYHGHYPKTKAQAEQEVRQAARQGLAAVILRPHLIWGPGDNYLAPGILARADRLRQVGDGTQRVDTIYIDNAAWAHILAEQQLKANPRLSGRVYFISQDEPIALWHMINLILAVGGKPPVSKKISPALAYCAGALCEMIYKLLRIKADPPMTRFVARELATSHWFNIEAAKKDLGYSPVISTEDGLKRLSEWLRTDCPFPDRFIPGAGRRSSA
jgi:nucleoside-diphosphate-sugar epimerase